VNEGRTRLTGRDFKRGGRTSNMALPLARIRDFAAGLVGGSLLAVLAHSLWLKQPSANTESVPAPRTQTERPATPEAEAEASGSQYDFYDMLPKFEVVVPEKEQESGGATPAAPVTRPGVYVLQAGSYRNQADAERVRSQLAKQGITAAVQRVAVDADVWHRVRIGPIGDLAQLNATRQSLRAADVDAIVVRVGD
jgi:cell division protein FtsN